MIAASPPPHGHRGFLFVMGVAALLVGGAIGGVLAPRGHRVEAAVTVVTVKPPHLPPPTPPPAPPPPSHFALPPPPAPRPGTLGPSCEAYLAELERMSRCAQLPADTRVQLERAIEQAASAFAQLPESAWAQTEDACRQGDAAVEQALAQLDCGSAR